MSKTRKDKIEFYEDIYKHIQKGKSMPTKYFVDKNRKKKFKQKEKEELKKYIGG